MNLSTRLAGTGLLALAMGGTAASVAAAAPVHAAAPSTVVSDHRATSGKAVFVATDGLTGNAVVAYGRRADGTLVPYATYETGGLGGALTGAVVDHTASQGALQLDTANHLLYVVNAGSNTLTVFRQAGASLTRLQVIGTHGDFPVSVAVHGRSVYVLNARSGGSVQGYLNIGGRLVSVPSRHAALGLDPAATPEFTHTPGQVAFTPDGQHLLVTTKANTNAVQVFNLGGGGAILGAPTITTLGTSVPFAVAFDPKGHLAVAEAGANAVATFRVRADGSLRALSSAATGQAATCWVVASGDHAYASNAGSGTVSGFTFGRGGSLTGLGNTATDRGTVDAAISTDGHFLYVQTGAAGIVDEYRIGRDGGLTQVGSVTVPDSVGAEGIAAS